MSTEMKSIAAVAFLILGLLFGLDAAASEEITMGAIVRTILLLGAAAIFYLWMMRDERSSEDAAGESMDEIEKQLDVVKEAVKDAKESAEERVEEALDYANMEPADDAEDKPVTELEPVDDYDNEEQDDDAIAVPDPGEQDLPEADASDSEDVTTTALAPEPKTVAITVSEDEENEIVPVSDPVVNVVDEPDDLTRVEGIGPKYRDILVAAGINTFAKLAAMSQAEIEQTVKDGGGRKSASMTTWAEQAKFAADGDWDGLQKFQNDLTGGRR